MRLNATIGDLGIYVIHALEGYKNHELRLKDLFKKEQLSFEFVTEGDPQFFNKEIINHYFKPSINEVLSIGVLSCTLNHFIAYEKMLEQGKSFALIFENDPFFLGNFTTEFEALANEIKSLAPGFIISLENSTLRFPSYWQTKKNKHIYGAANGRMAGAYLIDSKAAKAILEDLKTNKCNTVIDWWHNDLIKRNVIKMYWAHPALVEQGSHNGFLHATISSKKQNLKRKLAWKIQKLYKLYFRRLWNEKSIIF